MVENAVRHGIDCSKHGGDLVLNIQQSTTNQMIITVTNPGQISPEKAHQKDGETSTGIGIENIRKRLNLLFAEKASFELSQTNQQVVAKCSIPLENKN
jgi:two-component system, LytTR family, sensor kinase